LVPGPGAFKIGFHRYNLHHLTFAASFRVRLSLKSSLICSSAVASDSSSAAIFSAAAAAAAAAVAQGLTLVHFSAQPEPFLTQKIHTEHPLKSHYTP
jgi:hypothetical protein